MEQEEIWIFVIYAPPFIVWTAVANAAEGISFPAVNGGIKYGPEKQ